MLSHGYAGIVLARLGAQVVLTDLEPNLALLSDNCKANGKHKLSAVSTGACELYFLQKHCNLHVLQVRQHIA